MYIFILSYAGESLKSYGKWLNLYNGEVCGHVTPDALKNDSVPKCIVDVCEFEDKENEEKILMI